MEVSATLAANNVVTSTTPNTPTTNRQVTLRLMDEGGENSQGS